MPRQLPEEVRRFFRVLRNGIVVFFVISVISALCCCYLILLILEKFLDIPKVELFNWIASVWILFILIRYLCGRRVQAQGLQFIDRELGSLNFFREKVYVKWPDDWTASNTKVVRFGLDRARTVDIRVEVKCIGEILTSTNLFEQGELQVIFPSKKSGEYTISLWIGGWEARSSPWIRHVHPGSPYTDACRVVGPWRSEQGAVVPIGTESQSMLQIRDEFGNRLNCSRTDCDDVNIRIESSTGASPASFEHSVYIAPGASDITLSAKFQSVGSFCVTVEYRGVQLRRTQLLVLQAVTIADVELSLKDIANYSWNNYYMASLTTLSGEELSKPKNVYVYLKEKQLIVKEYFFKFIPRSIVSYRINPKVILRISGMNKLRISQLDFEGSDTVLVGQSALSLAAAYCLIISKRLGGKESFTEKREHFFSALSRHHEAKSHKHVRIPIVIHRSQVFDSTFRATRYFLESDWARLFYVSFDGEPGIDQGGLRKEWMELVSRHIFDPRNEMFVPIEDGGPGLQPNPFPPPHVKPKHYRLAGKLVGKCLYESSCGKTYAMNLNAMLAKSFLTQIIGIDVPYTILAADAPNLFESKVKYILENNVEDLDLTFTQEEVKGRNRISVELCPGGSNKVVTESNKKEYVHVLAKYLMVTRVHKQVEAFIEGVNTLVPSELLTLWDEGELELLICGIRQYNLQELKQKHAIVGILTLRFRKVLKWFWEALSHFSNEDMARFVQFVTGSSVLPSGGWAELSPELQIRLGEKGTLPMSQTCFNMLVLPETDNYEELERVLLLAIREGSEGFLMA